MKKQTKKPKTSFYVHEGKAYTVKDAIKFAKNEIKIWQKFLKEAKAKLK